MSNTFNVGIVGGSIAGCSAVILLSRAGHDVTVFERSRGALQGRGGGIARAPGALDRSRRALFEQRKKFA